MAVSAVRESWADDIGVQGATQRIGGDGSTGDAAATVHGQQLLASKFDGLGGIDGPAADEAITEAVSVDVGGR